MTPLAVPVSPCAAAAAPDPPERTAIALEALSRLKGMDLEANPGVKAAVLKLLDQVRGTPQFVEIIRDFKIKDQGPALLEFAARNPGDSAGVDAVRLLLANGDMELLRASLAGTNAVPMAEALGNTGEKEIIPLLQPVVVDSSRDAAVRRQAVRALARVQGGAVWLLELARRQRLPEDLKPAASAELNSVRWPDVKSEAGRVLPLSNAGTASPLPPISELMKVTGDAGRGAEVFRRDAVGCIKCHQVNGEGVDFGPNLSEIGAKLGKDALYQAILDPSVGISFGFEAWQIELKNGDEAYGLIVSDTADEIAVKAPGNIVTRYKKSEVTKREQQKLSVMPAGLEQTMSRQDLVDLVEYLASLKTKPKVK